MTTAEDALTNMIQRKIKERVLLLAIDHRINNTDPTIIDESSYLGDIIKARLERGEFLTEDDKLNLADYVLSYWINYTAIAAAAFETIDKAAKKED